ncbi:MAG: hypothetical protein HOO67_07195 [Candidatus Peribacteraceae bacterium]|nr:hypothetical protein [Candidatus Peribacteraceae bacterium]
MLWAFFLWTSGLLLGYWAVPFAVASLLLAHFPVEWKHWVFVVVTVLMIIGMFFFPLEYLSDPQLGTLHWTCRKSMVFSLYDKEKRQDSDHDSFSVDCEEQEQGDDNDATKIPNLPSLVYNIAPSFNSQYMRTCKIAKDATAFEFYHAGLIAKSAESYRFTIQGATLVCPIGEDDRKDAKMRCPFSPDFLEAFSMIKEHSFFMTVYVTVANQSAPEEFPMDCAKL